jgi:hypothetical protein
MISQRPCLTAQLDEAVLKLKNNLLQRKRKCELLHIHEHIYALKNCFYNVNEYYCHCIQENELKYLSMSFRYKVSNINEHSIFILQQFFQKRKQ